MQFSALTLLSLAACTAAFRAEIYTGEGCQGTPFVLDTTGCTDHWLDIGGSVIVTEGSKILAFGGSGCTNSGTWITSDRGCVSALGPQVSWRGVD